MLAIASLIRRVQGPPLRDLGAAAGFFTGGVAFYLLGLHAWTSDDPTLFPVGVRVLMLAVACAATALRRLTPLVGLAVAAAAAGAEATQGSLSLPMLLVVADLLYWAVLNTSQRASRLLVRVVAALALVGAATTAVFVRDWRLAFLTVLQVVALPGVPVWWALEVRQHREAADAERVRAEQVAHIAELDRRSAVAAERARMARDLHDVVAGHLSAIAIQSEAALSMADGDPDTVRGVLRSVRENSVESLTEMRAMIDVLRRDDADEPPDPRTAPARLRDLDRLLESARAGGLKVEFSTNLEAEERDGSALSTEPDAYSQLVAVVDLSAYRIVQEALTNAVRHAPGARAHVALRREGDHLTVDVTNQAALGGVNGRHAPAPSDRDGIGLLSMRERAQAVGGTMEAGPCADGWRVHAVLPVGGSEG